jgi:nicotinamidase-related amidase
VDVLLVVDMREALRGGPPEHDLDGVVERIAGLARRVRARGGRVAFVQLGG